MSELDTRIALLAGKTQVPFGNHGDLFWGPFNGAGGQAVYRATLPPYSTSLDAQQEHWIELGKRGIGMNMHWLASGKAICNVYGPDGEADYLAEIGPKPYAECAAEALLAALESEGKND